MLCSPDTWSPVPYRSRKRQGCTFPEDGAGNGPSCGTGEKKQGFTSPPKVYTEDTLLVRNGTAGQQRIDKDTEKSVWETPATRAAILKKLVSSGYVERKGKQMIPTEDGVGRDPQYPDYLKSPA